MGNTRRYAISLIFLVISMLVWHLFTSAHNDKGWYNDILNFKANTSDHAEGQYVLSYLAEKGYVPDVSISVPNDHSEITFYQNLMSAKSKAAIPPLTKQIKQVRNIDFALLLLSVSPVEQVPLFTLPQRYKERDLYQNIPFIQGVYNTHRALYPCHKNERNMRGLAKDGYIHDVAAFIVQTRNWGCSEYGLATEQERRDYACILKHYRGDDTFLNSVYESHALKGACGNQAKDWVDAQLQEPDSFFAKLKSLDFYAPSAFYNEDFFTKDQRCHTIPFAEYSDNLRATAYFKACIEK